MKNLKPIKVAVPIKKDGSGNDVFWMCGEFYVADESLPRGKCVALLCPGAAVPREYLVLQVVLTISVASQEPADILDDSELVVCDVPRYPSPTPDVLGTGTPVLAENSPAMIYARLGNDFGMRQPSKGSVLATTLAALHPDSHFPDTE